MAKDEFSTEFDDIATFAIFLIRIVGAFMIFGILLIGMLVAVSPAAQ